ncbi:hypothetical protein CAPTEDRAFT_93311 [Capitella teleta]|uniref:Innexin n=1 Tax=Capitella teleta TaxID=283909 RepID=R7T7A0_CAPTE|nr:hypothetical protein CAPTEDRAFT_93311 [Capitella teleta]|eukprot:ELT87275.1 hypothetical protein CAPTEDRAFT_93311 [Capitella teleta]
MSKVLSLLFGMKEVRFRCDDDFVDRMSRRYSATIFLLFSIVVTSKQYVGDPIFCWCPAQFTDSHKHYTNMICWVSNTYYVPLEETLPDTGQPKAMISYYQWVPIILLCQAMLCYVPSLIWRFSSKRSGFNVAACMEAAIAGQRTNYADIREKTVRYVVHQIDRYLVLRTNRGKGVVARLKYSFARYCCWFYGNFYGNFLMVCYMITKLLYLVNSIVQLYVLDYFLGTDFHMYGIEVLRKLYQGEDWSISSRFPRVTMCDFRIRHMNQLHRYVVQCVLPINLFNEKIFIFVWFWLCFLAMCTIISFLKWSWKSFYWPGQVNWVKRQLRPMENVKLQRSTLRHFTENYLKRDGMFLLRLIGANLGNVAAGEVICGLWNNHSTEMRYDRAPTAPPPPPTDSQANNRPRVKEAAQKLMRRIRTDSV